MRNRHRLLSVLFLVLLAGASPTTEEPVLWTYENKLTPIADAGPLLADYPEFVEPVRNKERFQACLLYTSDAADE